MADEELDETSDENLDDELEDEISDDESGDDHTESETSEDNDDQSEDEESDDSSVTDENESDGDDDDDESSEEPDKSKRTPEQIAKYERQRRKKAEARIRQLERDGRGTETVKTDGPKLPPGGLSERFYNTVVKVDIAEIAQTDPTVLKRAGLIKKIIFEEMKWLQQDPNGVKTANEIALGRTVKQTPGTESDTTVNRKTTPPEPRKPQSKTKFRVLSNDEIMRLSETQLRAYEDALAKHLATQS